MPVEERRRIALHRHVAAAWGEEAAATLFERIASAGHELATRQDLERGFVLMDSRLEALETHLDARFDAVEARLDARFEALEGRLDARLDARFATVDERFAKVDERFAVLGERFERRIADAVTTQTRTLVLSQLAALVAIAALAFGLR